MATTSPAQDRSLERHGFLDHGGNPPGFAKTYFTALNAARHALAKLEDYVKERTPVQDSQKVVHIVVRRAEDGEDIIEIEDRDQDGRAAVSS